MIGFLLGALSVAGFGFVIWLAERQARLMGIQRLPMAERELIEAEIRAEEAAMRAIYDMERPAPQRHENYP
ncbi:MAG TPA: hypothetical protein VLV50_13490 [Stellaceae bacterium]|nr:hypothetical protein [Stellaceae bacterium]